MLNDEVFFGDCAERCRAEKLNLDYIISEEEKKTCAMFEEMDDPYMKERASDIVNVCDEVIRRMNGYSGGSVESADEDFIVAAEELTPADTIKLDKKHLKGMVTERGGVTSHTVILAKTLGIPAVVGATGILDTVRGEECLYLDGSAGTAFAGTKQEINEKFGAGIQKEKEQQALYEQYAGKDAETKDGKKVSVCINSGDADSIKKFRPECCDGIGLFRTEFVYMGETDYPTEEKQFSVYKDITVKAAGKEVTIRTLDIGGDKKLDYMGLEPEDNPFLGYRAIRICLHREEMFLTQLRAILRASAFGHIRIMFPMIVTLTEFREARAQVEKAKKQLDERGEKYDSNIETGVMIETPGAVLISDRLAEECDFFSIGTNDLIQYVTASDRMNQNVQYLYDVCNISVLRAIGTVIKNAHKYGRKTGMCGEAASDERMTPVWLGLGLDEFSMAPSRVGQIKYRLSGLDSASCRETAEKVLNADSEKEVRKILEENK